MLGVTFLLASLVVEAGMMGASGFTELFLDGKFHFPLQGIFIVSLLFLILLFVESFRTRGDYLGGYRLQNRVGPVTGLWGAMVALLANPDASGKIIADLLFVGPRLLTWSVMHMARIVRLLRTDSQMVCEVLSVLHRRLHRISFGELTRLLAGQDPMKPLIQLQEIDCVLFLAKEPAGVILTPETREELDQILGRGIYFDKSHFESRPPQEEPVPPPPVENAECYTLLGIQPTASFTEIKSAYRQRIKQCHPDKFASRGPEFRQLAEERAKALNEAYAILSSKHNSDVNGSSH
ncbi:MAG TPA: J domain-containing protein [Verrucomicrobiae bacterium]|nr:J domain-containing protein [Verrucomicrobiae bacterium]